MSRFSLDRVSLSNAIFYSVFLIDTIITDENHPPSLAHKGLLEEQAKLLVIELILTRDDIKIGKWSPRGKTCVIGHAHQAAWEIMDYYGNPRMDYHLKNGYRYSDEDFKILFIELPLWCEKMNQRWFKDDRLGMLLSLLTNMPTGTLPERHRKLALVTATFNELVRQLESAHLAACVVRNGMYAVVAMDEVLPTDEKDPALD